MIKNKKRAGFTLLNSRKANLTGFTLLNSRKANLTGFTLMELLIVIAIIAILAAGLIVGLNPARHFRQARNSTRWSHMNAIATAVYSYAVENGGNFPEGCIGGAGFPEPIAAVDYENPTMGDWCYGADAADLLITTYLRFIPKDPQGKSGPIAGQTIYYQIEFVDAEETGIKITSTAQEAIDDKIVLIQ